MFAVVFDDGDDPIAGLHELARRESLSAAGFTGIGALREATLGYFDPDAKEYLKREIAEQCEILSLVGDVALDPEGDPAVHAHVVLGTRDFAAIGGHLFGGLVWPTCEILLHESPAHLQKRHDPATGLALIRP